ncbi:unnamed protein product [Prorocentrum cordatum]|uniref:Uncharacterized protein n=1 Tax=Prorocentrum cordatum TaxID=2364126 RepID=A0ABN9V540_9DINO|nr:unnamed protein product [Polarella glacialis]
MWPRLPARVGSVWFSGLPGRARQRRPLLPAPPPDAGATLRLIGQPGACHLANGRCSHAVLSSSSSFLLSSSSSSSSSSLLLLLLLLLLSLGPVCASVPTRLVRKRTAFKCNRHSRYDGGS